MKTLILFTPNKITAASAVKIVRQVDSPAEAKKILKDQTALAEIFKEHPQGGQLLIVPPSQQHDVVPVTHFLVTEKPEE